MTRLCRGAELEAVFFLCYQLGDSYIFWPEWNECAAGMQVDVPEISFESVILEFLWPALTDMPFEVPIYAALTNPDVTCFIGATAETSFSWVIP